MTARTECRFRSPRVKSAQGRVSARAQCERFRPEIPGAIVRAQQRLRSFARARARRPGCALRIMSLLFSFSDRAIAPSLFIARSFVHSFPLSVVPFYSDRSLSSPDSPLSSSIRAQVAANGGRVLAEITNSLATNNFHSTIETRRRRRRRQRQSYFARTI